MNTPRTTQRVQILAAVVARIEALFGPQGTVAAVFRGVRGGPWNPGTQPMPCCTVVDAGQSGGDQAGDADMSKGRVLKLQLILECGAQFDRADRVLEWADVVALLDEQLTNFNPRQAVHRFEFQADEPMEIALASGASAAVWTIDFECEYTQEFGAFGD